MPYQMALPRLMRGIRYGMAFPTLSLNHLCRLAAIGALGLIHARGESGPISEAKLNESSSLISNYYDAFVSGTSH